MTTSQLHQRARAYFPRGLSQPPDSFRFSVDALLLASFALRFCLPERRAVRMLDLGCGSGVVGLACLMKRPELSAIGVDIVPDLLAAAEMNAVALGVKDRFSVLLCDLEQSQEYAVLPTAYEVVTANPPYRMMGTGRLPLSEIRRKALFASPRTVPSFIKNASRSLAPGGSFALIYPWDTREDLCKNLERCGFAVKILLPVHSVRAKPLRCLVKASLERSSFEEPVPECNGVGGRCRQGALLDGKDYHSNAGGTMLLLPPLVLHGSSGGPYTDEALAFCPWLGGGAAGCQD